MMNTKHGWFSESDLSLHRGLKRIRSIRKQPFYNSKFIFLLGFHPCLV
jgi:hypothetical protein